MADNTQPCDKNPAEPEKCQRCHGEEVIWGGCLQESDGNYFDPCPDCMGFDDEED